MSKTFSRGEKNVAGEFASWLCLSRSGQFIWLGSNFERAVYILKQVSVQVSLNTNVCCDELEDISGLKIFLNTWIFLARLFVVVEPQFSIFCQKCCLHFSYQKCFCFHKLPNTHFRALSTNKS